MELYEARGVCRLMQINEQREHTDAIVTHDAFRPTAQPLQLIRIKSGQSRCILQLRRQAC